MTGFDLMRQFDDSVGYVWHAPHPQIYPELRRLEDAGFVAGEEVPRGTHAKKRLYSITDAGVTELRRLVADVEEPRRERDPMRLKASYFEYVPLDVARTQLERHLAYFEERVRVYEEVRVRLQARDSDLLKARLAITPEADHATIVAFKVFAYAGIVRRAQAEVDWAREGLVLLEKLSETSLAQIRRD
jgi:DNA-binding PadR family transcriptional regulator